MLESRIAQDLKLAGTIYTKFHLYCYVNYMRRALIIYRYLIPESSRELLGDYCNESFPDACSCGHILSVTGDMLRSHCRSCRGFNRTSAVCSYDVQQLSQELKIDPSWIEYSLAWGLQLVSQSKEK